MKSARWWVAGLIIALLGLVPVTTGQAQASVTFRHLSASHVFGESLHFEAEIATTAPLSRLELIFKPQEGSSVVLPVNVTGGTRLEADYQIGAMSGFAPFSQIEYWFLATLDNGQQIQSETEILVYSDNRYTWQSMDYGSNFHAHWIDGDTGFGQAILDAAINSLSRFEQFISLPIPETLDIYVYPSSNSLQSALEVSGTSWTAGHADQSENRVYAAITNSFDYALDMENTVPHEVTHIRLHLLLRENYPNLPAWLSEGLATMAERNPRDNTLILNAALDEGALFSFKDLCGSFPGDSTGAVVAYAQSESLTRFVYAEYGKTGLQTLVQAFGAGHSCEKGVLGSLGITLEELEAEWYMYQFGQAAPVEPTAAGSAFGWTILAGALFLAPLALLLFSRLGRDEEEVLHG